MITLFLVVSAMCVVHGQIVPLVYAAPSAVSHQSRIDIKHSPGFIAGPLIYRPATTLYASHLPDDKPRETVLSPVFTADTILTPVALTFFHNLPLARALEHPISIDKVQEEILRNDAVAEEDMKKDKDVQIAIVTEIPEQDKGNTEEKQEVQDKNYVIIAFDDNKQVTSTTDEPNMVGVTKA
ncbi:hypothetical protein PYW08_013453 [Mythimna loreyi]|uniref:Uncharacterized protein n=1 Tax=Mythimna loreyi TaxID=667449 RepID=A0ACC2QFL3_9NEOP|nr:hypothetical protein PYW08_013453 [Mythimna loreyi]